MKSRLRSALILTTCVLSCAQSPWAGSWDGLRKPAKALPEKQKGYSETKASMKSSLELDSNGTYQAKFEDVDYAGTWEAKGSRISLKPKTYMGMERSNFQIKGGTGGNIDNLFAAYDMDASSDGKTLTHTDKLGVVTFTKKR